MTTKMQWEDREWTAEDFRQEISRLCRMSNGTLSRDRLHRVEDIALWMEKWIETLNIKLEVARKGE